MAVLRGVSRSGIALQSWRYFRNGHIHWTFTRKTLNTPPNACPMAGTQNYAGYVTSSISTVGRYKLIPSPWMAGVQCKFQTTTTHLHQAPTSTESVETQSPVDANSPPSNIRTQRRYHRRNVSAVGQVPTQSKPLASDHRRLPTKPLAPQMAETGEGPLDVPANEQPSANQTNASEVRVAEKEESEKVMRKRWMGHLKKLSKHGDAEGCLIGLRKMEAGRLQPDVGHYTNALLACTLRKFKAPDRGRKAITLLKEIKKKGLPLRPFLYSVTINAQYDNARTALQLVEEAEEEKFADVNVYNACISVLGRGGEVEVASKLFVRLQLRADREGDPALQPSKVTYSALISAASKADDADLALTLLDRAVFNRTDCVESFGHCLSVCSRQDRHPMAVRLYKEMRHRFSDYPSFALGPAAVSLFAENEIDAAWAVLQVFCYRQLPFDEELQTIFNSCEMLVQSANTPQSKQHNP